LPENVVGYKGDQTHDRLVTKLLESYDNYRQKLSPRFKEMSSDTRLYLGYRVDRRQAHEKWRSWSQLGDPYQQTETEANAWLEIMNSTDPSYAVEGVGKEDEWKARAYERQIDYTLRGNEWTQKQSNVYRVVSYQGMRVLKTGWREVKYQPMRRPTKQELIDWDEALNEALKTGKVQSPPDPMSQPEEFGGWLEATQSIFPSFPSPPTPAPSEVIQYRGPWFSEISNFDLAYDPFVERWQDQDLVFQRIVKPRDWGEQMVEKGVFDEGQFREAGRGSDEGRLASWDREISSQIGLVQDDNDPRWKTSDEYLEVWRQFDSEAPHLIIMNRATLVGTTPEHPFWHRQLPYVCTKNNVQPGHAVGIGSYAQMRRIFDDRLLMRDLMFDALILSVMPVFLKNRNLGMTELQRFLQPGMILEVNDANGFKRGWESMPGFSELLSVSQRLMDDQNQILSTGENVRGQSSTVGRVSATESQARLTQALTRHKQKATRLEEEQSPLLYHALELIYQFMPKDDPALVELRAKMIGEDEQDPEQQQTPVAAMGMPVRRSEPDPRDIFAEDLAMNVKFRGATTKLNKELMAQQIKDFLSLATQIQSAAGIPINIMTPGEARAALRRAWEALGQKGASDIFTAEGDAAVAKAVEAHLITAQTAPLAAQSQALQVQGQIQQLTNPQPQIDPATGQPVAAQPSQGGEQAQPMQEQPAPQGNGQAQEAGFV
jgi:hypothetical protein